MMLAVGDASEAPPAAKKLSDLPLTTSSALGFEHYASRLA